MLRRRYWLPMVIIVALLALTGIAAAQNMPSIWGAFYGQLQYNDLTMINVGDVAMKAEVAGVTDWPSGYGNGNVNFVWKDGHESQLNMWDANHVFRIYVPENVVALYMTGNQINWTDIGPWHVNTTGTGLYRAEITSTIEFSMTEPVSVTFTGSPMTVFEWKMFVSPPWVYAQTDLSVKIPTNCNSKGVFEWNMTSISGSAPYAVQLSESFLSTKFVEMKPVTWTIAHKAAGSPVLRSGTTMAPICKMPKISGEFFGQMQYDLSVYNVGDLTLRLDVSDITDWPAAYNGGTINVVMSGQTYSFTNWTTICPGGGVPCFRQWTMALPDTVTEVYMSGNPISWHNVGPWHVNSAGTGLVRSEMITRIEVAVEDPMSVPAGDYTGWVWRVRAYPDWVHATSPLSLTVETNCTGYTGKNPFSWNMSYLYGSDYDPVGVTEFVLKPKILSTTPVSWTLKFQNSDTILREGTTLAPHCATTQLWIPLVWAQ